MSNYLNGNAALNIQDESNSEQWPIFNRVEISKDSQFTVIDPDNVYHDFDELMELKRATGLPYKKCVAYRPERLALHETFVGALTTVTLDDDKHQRQVVEDLYDNCILPETKRLTPHFARRRCEIYKNAFIAVDSLSKGIDISHMPNADVVLKKWKMVQDRIKADEYTPNHFNEQEIISTLVRDEIFTEEVSNTLRNIVEDRLI